MNTNANTILSEGLLGLLKPVVVECDQRIQAVFDSQTVLAAQIDTLAAELDTFVGLTTIPPLAPHLQKLQNSRNRLIAVNTTLVNIMNRLDRINNSINPKEKGSSEKKVFGGFSIFKTTTPITKTNTPIPTQNPSINANTTTTTSPTPTIINNSDVNNNVNSNNTIAPTSSDNIQQTPIPVTSDTPTTTPTNTESNTSSSDIIYETPQQSEST